MLFGDDVVNHFSRKPPKPVGDCEPFGRRLLPKNVG
jgi:hypothetical protein